MTLDATVLSGFTEGEAGALTETLEGFQAGEADTGMDLYERVVKTLTRWLGFDRKWGADLQALMRKVRCLEPWEAAWLVQANQTFWKTVGKTGFQGALVASGLVSTSETGELRDACIARSTHGITVTYSCGHAEETIIASTLSNTLSRVFTAPVPCPECRAAEAHSEAVAAKLALFEGVPRAIVRATIIRREFLDHVCRLRVTFDPDPAPVFPDSSAQLLRLTLEARFAAGVTDPWWWIDHGGAEHSLTEKAMTLASQTELEMLVNVRDPRLRDAASAVLGARTSGSSVPDAYDEGEWRRWAAAWLCTNMWV